MSTEPAFETAIATDIAPMLLRTDHDGVATLTLDHGATRNALSGAMMVALQAQIDAIAADARVHCVLLAARGPVFCSGHDLKEITTRRSDPDRGAAFYAALLSDCAALMQSIVRLPQPVIAAVEGVATAAGCQLVASCDLAVAGADARFCTPGVQIGLFCSTPMVALSRNLSRKHAMEMLLTGEMVDADTAVRMGLVNRVVAAGAASVAAAALAASIASRSAQTVRIGKRAFYEQAEMGLADAYAHASQVMTANLLAADAREGIEAFLRKRPAKWAQDSD